MRIALLLALLTASGCAAVSRQRPPDPYFPSSPRSSEPRFDASQPGGGLVSFIARRNPRLSAAEVQRLARVIERCSREQGVDPRLTAAVIARESSFNARAVSPTGAKGLGQLIPSTARWLGVDDPFDPQQNITAVTKYLHHLEELWRGHPRATELVIASYNLGQGTVKRTLERGGRLPEPVQRYVQDVSTYFHQI